MRNIIQFNEDVKNNKLNELVRGSVEETLNQLLDQEADRLTNALISIHEGIKRQGKRGQCD